MSIVGEAALLFVVLLMMLGGMIGIIVPILPGIFLVWLGVALYVWQTGFEIITVPVFLVMSLLVLFAGTSDLWLPYFGAARSGAAKRTYLLSTIGAIAGSFILPIIGTIIGFVAGLYVGEYWKHGNSDVALKVSWGGLKGWGIATVIQIVAGMAIIALFAWQVVTA